MARSAEEAAWTPLIWLESFPILLSPNAVAPPAKNAAAGKVGISEPTARARQDAHIAMQFNTCGVTC